MNPSTGTETVMMISPYESYPFPFPFPWGSVVYVEPLSAPPPAPVPEFAGIKRNHWAIAAMEPEPIVMKKKDSYKENDRLSRVFSKETRVMCCGSKMHRNKVVGPCSEKKALYTFWAEGLGCFFCHYHIQQSEELDIEKIPGLAIRVKKAIQNCNAREVIDVREEVRDYIIEKLGE